jgi:hypothetical protein
MADIGNTTNRIHFASAGDVRRRPSPVETASFDKSSPFDKSSGDIRGAHADLIRRLRALPPYRFDSRLQATPEQLELQADTLRCNLLAMQQYVVALVRDTAYHTTTIDTDRLHLDGLFRDIIGDLCGAITIAADKVREDGVYVGSAA